MFQNLAQQHSSEAVSLSYLVLPLHAQGTIPSSMSHDSQCPTPTKHPRLCLTQLHIPITKERALCMCHSVGPQKDRRKDGGDRHRVRGIRRLRTQNLEAGADTKISLCGPVG